MVVDRPAHHGVNSIAFVTTLADAEETSIQFNGPHSTMPFGEVHLGAFRISDDNDERTVSAQMQLTSKQVVWAQPQIRWYNESAGTLIEGQLDLVGSRFAFGTPSGGTLVKVVKEDFEGASGAITVLNCPGLQYADEGPVTSADSRTGAVSANLSVIETFGFGPQVGALFSDPQAIGTWIKYPAASIDNGSAHLVVSSVAADGTTLTGQFALEVNQAGYGFAANHLSAADIEGVDDLGSAPMNVWLNFEITRAGAWKVMSAGGTTLFSGTAADFVTEDGGYMVAAFAGTGFPGETHYLIDEIYSMELSEAPDDAPGVWTQFDLFAPALETATHWRPRLVFYRNAPDFVIPPVPTSTTYIYPTGTPVPVLTEGDPGTATVFSVGSNPWDAEPGTYTRHEAGVSIPRAVAAVAKPPAGWTDVVGIALRADIEIVMTDGPVQVSAAVIKSDNSNTLLTSAGLIAASTGVNTLYETTNPSLAYSAYLNLLAADTTRVRVEFAQDEIETGVIAKVTAVWVEIQRGASTGTDVPASELPLAVGQRVYIDCLYVPDNGRPVATQPYLDGDQAFGVWEGTPRASSSIYGTKPEVEPVEPGEGTFLIDSIVI